jgi:hypothetical protein
MTIRRCQLCCLDMPNEQFGKHVNDHSEFELEQWPGGPDALDHELDESIRESQASLKAAT